MPHRSHSIQENPKNEPYPWLEEKVYTYLRQRTADLVRSSVDALCKDKQRVSLSTIVAKSKELDAEGKGISESANFNSTMVAIKLAAVFFVVLVGVFYINPENWKPFAPFGLTGVGFFGKPVFGNTNAGGHANTKSDSDDKGDQPLHASVCSNRSERWHWRIYHHRSHSQAGDYSRDRTFLVSIRCS